MGFRPRPPETAPVDSNFAAPGRDFKQVAIGVIPGIVYGLILRAGFALPALQPAFALLSFAFLILVPLGIGIVTVSTVMRRGEEVRWPGAVFIPWIPTFICLAISMLIGWEGTICVIVMAPLAIICASIGGLMALDLNRRKKHDAQLLTVAALILPFLVAPIEQQLPPAEA